MEATEAKRPEGHKFTKKEQPAKEPALLDGTPAPAATKAPTTRYRVVVGKRFNWQGASTEVVTGQIITVAGYGEDGIKRLRDQHVVLEALD